MLAGKLCVVHYSYWIKADSKIVFIRWNREERDGFSFYIMLFKALTSIYPTIKGGLLKY